MKEDLEMKSPPHTEVLTIPTTLSTLEAAKWLIGKELVTFPQGRACGGFIVETEAYGPLDDPASHAHRGETPRNSVMFRAAGSIYVYKIYGVHYCVNFVTETAGVGCAVLVRALEPTRGTEEMVIRRGGAKESEVTRGPGNICQSLGIDASFNGERLLETDRIALYPGRVHHSNELVFTKRIGISKAADLPWRVLLGNSRLVSGKRIKS